MDLENLCTCQSDLENLSELQLVIRALLAEGIRELSNTGGIRGGGVTAFCRLARRGGFSEGLGTPRRRRVNQGLDTSKSDQGLDKSKSAAYGYRGATRHVVAT